MSQNRAVEIRVDLEQNKKLVDEALSRLRNRIADEIGRLHEKLYPGASESQVESDWDVLQRVLLEQL